MAYRGRYLLKVRSRRLCVYGKQQVCLCSQCEFYLSEAVCRHPPGTQLCQLRKPPPLVSSLILLGTVPILDRGGWLVPPQLLHIPLARLVWTVDELLKDHLPPPCHGGYKPLSPAPWPPVLCLCPSTDGHCSSNVLALELSTVFPHPVWPHSQASLRNIDSRPFLIQLTLTKKAGFSLLSVSERGSEEAAASLKGMVASQQEWAGYGNVLSWHRQARPRMSSHSHVFQSQV